MSEPESSVGSAPPDWDERARLDRTVRRLAIALTNAVIAKDDRKWQDTWQNLSKFTKDILP